MTIADAVTTADITVDAVIIADTGIANDSCTWHSDWHE